MDGVGGLGGEKLRLLRKSRVRSIVFGSMTGLRECRHFVPMRNVGKNVMLSKKRRVKSTRKYKCKTNEHVLEEERAGERKINIVSIRCHREHLRHDRVTRSGGFFFPNSFRI